MVYTFIIINKNFFYKMDQDIEIGEALLFIQLENCGACENFQKKYWNNSYMLKYLNSKNIKPLRFTLSPSDKKILPKRITSFFEKGMMFPTFIYCKNYDEFMKNINNDIHCYGYKLSNGLLIPDATSTPSYDIIIRWIEKSKIEPFPMYLPKPQTKRSIIIELGKNNKQDEFYNE